MVVIDRKYAGAAVLAHVSGSMTAGSPGSGGTFTVDDGTGYPLTGKFPVVIDRGLATEEKILISSRSGTTFTVSSSPAGRGYDGTSAQSHAASATCELALDAISVNLMVDHVDDVEVDPHSTKLLNNTRHDVTARHTFGAALGTPGVPTALTPDIAGSAGVGTVPARSDHTHNVPAAAPGSIAPDDAATEGVAATFARSDHVHGITAAVPVSVGTALAEGVAANFARSDHVHELGSGSIDTAAFFANNVLPLAAIPDGLITLLKFASEASSTYTPAAFSDSTFDLGTGGTKYGHYYKLGRIVVGWAGFSMAADGNLLGTVLIPLPVAMRTVTDGFRGFCAGRAQGGSLVSSGTGVVLGGNSQVNNLVTAGSSATWDATTPFNWGTAGVGACTLDTVFFYEAAT